MSLRDDWKAMRPEDFKGRGFLTFTDGDVRAEGWNPKPLILPIGVSERITREMLELRLPCPLEDD